MHGGLYDRFRQQEVPSPNASIKRTSPEMVVIAKSLAEISSGLRILEDRYSNLRKKTQLTDQSLLETQRNFSKEKRILSEELVEAKMKMQDLIDDMRLMKTELSEAVKQKDIKVLEKYLDMWEPIQFVTRKEVEKILEERDTPENDL